MNTEGRAFIVHWVRSASLSRAMLMLIPVTLLFAPKVNVYVIALYTGLVVAQPDAAGRFRGALRHRWVLAFWLLYALHLLSLLWTEHQPLGWFILEKKFSLLLLPVVIAADAHLDRRGARQVQAGFMAGVAALVLICLAMAGWRYVAGGDPQAFFYHNLGAPFDLNAIYFSLYVFTAMVFLDQELRDPESEWGLGRRRPALTVLLTAVLMLALALLASRLFLTLLGVALTVRMGRYVRFRRWPALILLAGGALLVIGLLRWLDVPRLRFEELIHSRLEVVRQDRFAWNTEFNGLTLRLLLLRFGAEILREEEAFLFGLGAGDAQPALNGRMRSYGVYLGNPELGDTGYLNYNFHNQYLELWVQAGLAALLVFVMILYRGLTEGWKSGWSAPLFWVAVALIAFGATECFLERQRGVVFFAFFLPFFQALNHEKKL